MTDKKKCIFFFVLLYIFGILLLILSSLLKPNIFGQKNELAGDGWDFLNSFFFFSLSLIFIFACHHLVRSKRGYVFCLQNM